MIFPYRSNVFISFTYLSKISLIIPYFGGFVKGYAASSHFKISVGNA